MTEFGWTESRPSGPRAKWGVRPDNSELSDKAVLDDRSSVIRTGRGAELGGHQNRQDLFPHWPSDVIVSRNSRLWSLGLSGESVRIWVHSDQVMGGLSLMDVLVPPSLCSLLISHEDIQIVATVTEGKFEMSLDGRRWRVPCGTAVVVPRGVIFGWRNMLDEEGQMTLTLMGGGIEQLLRAREACENLDDFRVLAQTYGSRIYDRLSR